VAVIFVEERSTRDLAEDSGTPARESNNRSPECGLGIDGEILQAKS